jgi:hypothetical protein
MAGNVSDEPAPFIFRVEILPAIQFYGDSTYIPHSLHADLSELRS